MTSPGQVLAGCVVLITANRRSAELGAALARRGAAVRHAPAISTVEHPDDEQLLLDTKRVIATRPGTIVITSGIGFRRWVEAADAAGIADELLDAFADARIVTRGTTSREAVHAAGLATDWVAEAETSAELLEILLSEGVSHHRIAVQQHGGGADGLDTELAAAGADVTSLVVYRWGPPPDPEALAESATAAADGEVDAVVFTSAPAVRAWLAAAEEAGVIGPLTGRLVSGSLVAAAIGHTTAGPLVGRGVQPLVPERPRLGALVRVLVAHYEQDMTTAVGTTCGDLQVRGKVALLDGRVLPLAPGGLELLRLLAGARGDVVTRGQVLEVLPGFSQDPHAAEVAVARLREAAGSKRLVQTVVRRGYRLAVT
jgi:uroporphyrinogen-III synthase